MFTDLQLLADVCSSKSFVEFHVIIFCLLWLLGCEAIISAVIQKAECGYFGQRRETFCFKTFVQELRATAI